MSKTTSDGDKTSRTRSRPSRRGAICEAALDLAAAGGNHAVTHYGIDDHLGIARGSTSYYYRTRQALLTAAIIHLTSLSRQAFHDAFDTGDTAPDIDWATDLTATQLELLLGPRRRDALARYALATGTIDDDELREALASCLFSAPGAQALMTALGAPDPSCAAGNFISLLEGLLFDRLHGSRSMSGIVAGSEASISDLRQPIRLWLTALQRGI
ncbi:TetR family transcriptional regulator [Rhodococcus sp. IEGM 1379]|uniref:TetR/AcrR family transcriptional regulator n=1 Tax=Rhodococcus sp. IEGM 1379 TaxID=3047086 RepID=UPI0024B81525|nr:TetR family transcriptional regulator [Rhodococcus sp. IEGM 1379]MDI9915430.1 TetR family transcriptional regulator [Rhodococcus sp. IEGM 1379]